MSNPDLSLVSEDDLLEELMSRFDHACFGGVKQSYAKKGTDRYVMRHLGDYIQSGGLANQLAYISACGHEDDAEKPSDE